MDSLPLHQFVWKGIRRRTFRNIITVLTFAVVAGTLIMAYFLVGGAQNSAQVGMDRLGADLLVVPEQYESATDAMILSSHPSTFYFNSSELAGVATVPGVEKVSYQTYIATLNAGCCAFPTQLVAFDASNDFTIQPWLKDSLGRSLEKDEIIMGSSYIGGGVGIHLIFYGHDFTIAGILEPTGTGIDQSVFIQYADALAMANDSSRLAVQPLDLRAGQISSVLVKLTEGADPEVVAQQITADVPGSFVISSNHLARKINDNLSGTVGSLYMTAEAVTLVSIPLVAIISIQVANERMKELGLLRAMGADRRFVFSIVMVEAVLLAFVGALIGIIGGGAAIILFKNLITTSLNIPFLWPSLFTILGQVLTVVAIAIAFGGLASLYPAFKASRQDPYESIRVG